MIASAFAILGQRALAGTPPPALGGGEAFVFPIERMAFGLALCVLLIWGAALIIRRYRQTATPPQKGALASILKTNGRRLRVLESRRTGSSGDVCLIVCDEREYLVAITTGHALLLHETEARIEDADPNLTERAE